MSDSQRAPLSFPLESYLYDHHFFGKAVYPAVEGLQSLAIARLQQDPTACVTQSENAQFGRFLPLPPQGEKNTIEALAEFDEDGGARLLSSFQSPKSGIRRNLEHIRLHFGELPELALVPLDRLAAPEGVACRISGETLYNELVPFGASFHNATGEIFLTPDGALGEILAPSHSEREAPLGSPFVLDAAFHIACAWGQYAQGIVGIPVGYEQRCIHVPTQAGGRYICRIFPKAPEGDVLRYDLYVLQADGVLCESLLGLRMGNIFKGKMTVPDWLQQLQPPDFSAFKQRCEQLAIVELDAVIPFENRWLSKSEIARSANFHPRRWKSYLAGRAALKRLARLSSGENRCDATDIETFDDAQRPLCRIGKNEQNPMYCSLSHDERFAVAVGGSKPLGVDVERIGERVIKGQQSFMNPAERRLVEQSELSEMQAATRIWSLKEAAAKALDRPLPMCWKTVEAVEIERDRSLVLIDERQHWAVHMEVDEHVFTLLVLDGERP